MNLASNAQYKSFVSNDVFQTKYYIENKGQFNTLLKENTDIDFAVMHDNDEIYFNENGFKYHIVKATPHKETNEERREEKKKDELEEEDEERVKYDVVEDWFTLEWIGANAHAVKQQFEKSKHYFTYGASNYNSYGYKAIGYKNIYPGIDVKYELHEKGGIEYSLLLKPNANLSDIQFKYSSQKGVNISNKKDKLIIENKIGKLIESNIKAFYPNGEEVHLEYEMDANNIVRFKSLNNYDNTKGLIIDPWVTAVTSLSGIATSCNNMAYDVDYDLAGNLIAIGGGGSVGANNINLPKLAKYDNLGNIIWTFSGNVISPAWNSSPLVSTGVTGSVGNFTIDKLTNKIYMSQGFNLGVGASVIRLDQNGNYDNFTSIPNSQMQEIWEMKFDCTNGKLMAMGGSTNSNLNFGVIDTTTGSVVTMNVTGLAILRQDVVSATLDDNGEIFTLLANNYPPQTVNNKIFKLNATNTASIWSTFSGFSDFVEADNKIFSLVPYFSNGFNALHVNANFLFYYDGIHLKAFDKTTGAAVGTPLTIAGHASKMQGGIYANNCNEIYVGGNNGNILQYVFNGTIFVLQNTISINGFAGKSVFDIVYNPLNNLLYASGNGFVSTLDPQSTCPINSSVGNIQLGYSLQCPDSALVTVLNPIANTAYTFIWIDSTTNTTLQTTTLPVGVNSHGLSGLVAGHTINVSVLKSSACQVLTNDTSFVINCAISTSINVIKCPGDSIVLSNNTIVTTPGIYIDTFTNVNNQDSLVTITFSNYQTFSTTNNQSICQGQSYVLPNGTSVNIAGSYLDTLNSVNGCDSMITTILVINPLQTTTIYDTICIGNNYTLPDNSIVSAAGTYTSVLPNQFNCDSTVIVHLFVLSQIVKTENISLCSPSSYVLPNGSVINTNGTYVSNINNPSGCDSMIISHVEFNPAKNIQMNVNICENKNYTLPNNTIVNTAGTFYSNFLTSKGCDSIITTIITTTKLPKVDLGNDTMLCEDVGIKLSVYNANATYLWSDNSILPTNAISSEGIFYVDVTRPPCEPVRDSIEIVGCTCHVFIPNAFTPNNDTKNDVFKPIISCLIPAENYSFKIFNKWGQQVFYTTMQDDGWDGTFFQVPQSMGTFMYLLQFKNPVTGKTETFKGDVTLVR